LLLSYKRKFNFVLFWSSRHTFLHSISYQLAYYFVEPEYTSIHCHKVLLYFIRRQRLHRLFDHYFSRALAIGIGRYRHTIHTLRVAHNQSINASQIWAELAEFPLCVSKKLKKNGKRKIALFCVPQEKGRGEEMIQGNLESDDNDDRDVKHFAGKKRKQSDVSATDTNQSQTTYSCLPFSHE